MRPPWVAVLILLQMILHPGNQNVPMNMSRLSRWAISYSYLFFQYHPDLEPKVFLVPIDVLIHVQYN